MSKLLFSRLLHLINNNMKYFARPIKVASTPLEANENHVQSGLALTPAKMAQMTAQGKTLAMSSMADAAYYSGETSQYIPLEFQRGRDLNDAWEQQQRSKAKLNKFQKSVQSQQTPNDGN